MIEVLIAVLIVGLVATASLKLIALSERGLYTVRKKENLLDKATVLQIDILRDPSLNTFGTSGDLTWRIEDKRTTLWQDEDIDIESLSLESGSSSDALPDKELRWRELEIIGDGNTLKLFLPYDEASEAASADVVSGD